MALLFMEGFDAFTSLTPLVNLGWSFSGSAALSLTRGTNGSRALDISGGSHDAYALLSPTLGTYGEVFYGFAFIPSSFGSNPLYTALQNSSGSTIISFNISQTSIIAYRGSTTLATYNFARPLQLGNRAFFEFHVKVSDTVGVVEIKKDGVSLGTLTNIDTNNTTGDAYRIWFAASNSAITGGYIDDLYICDATGSSFNTFLGNVTMKHMEVQAASTHQDFVASAGTAIAVLTDEDNDADYIGASAAGSKSDFTLPTVPSTRNVLAVKVTARMALDEAGSVNVKVGMSSSGVDASSTQTVTATGYSNFYHTQQVDPNTGVAWTAAGLSAALPFVEVA